MASISSSGEKRPSTATDCDQTIANPIMEFFSNSAAVIS
jgi:hypothetical protein